MMQTNLLPAARGSYLGHSQLAFTPATQGRSKRRQCSVIRSGLLDAVSSLISRGNSSAQSLAAESRLLQAIEGTDKGMSTSPEQKAAILEAVEELEERGRGSVTTSGSISATWKLLWTTEKAQPLSDMHAPEVACTLQGCNFGFMLRRRRRSSS